MADAAKSYLYERKIPQLFESLMAALMYHKPDDHIAFLQQCLAKATTTSGEFTWDTFVVQSNSTAKSSRNEFSNSKPLPPIPGDIPAKMDNEEPLQSGDTDKYTPLPPIPDQDTTSATEQEALNTTSITNKDITEAVVPHPPEGKDKDGSSAETVEAALPAIALEDTSQREEELQKAPIIFVLGGPGSGKGTQCSRIVQDYGFTHLSAGDLLREAVAKGTPQGQQIEEIMRQGKLVPPEVTIGLLKQAMLLTPDTRGFLIDGFPRELSQGKIFTEQVCECAYVLVFECSESVMVERLLQRGATSGRVDDNVETIKKRLNTYQQATLPVIEHYQKLNKVKQINSDRSIDDVYGEVSELFTEITESKAKGADKQE